MTMTLIETKTLGAAAASIEFTSIPQDGTDLVVLASLRHATTQADLYLTFNTGGTYSVRYLFGNGASVSSGAQSNNQVGITTTIATTFSNTGIYVPNYTSSSAKSFSSDDVTENNATTAFQSIWAGLWTGTDAITTLKLSPQTGNLAADSTISLYKITKGSDGIVTTS